MTLGGGIELFFEVEEEEEDFLLFFGCGVAATEDASLSEPESSDDWTVGFGVGVAGVFRFAIVCNVGLGGRFGWRLLNEDKRVWL